MAISYDAVVVAGGQARRFGADKLSSVVAGRSLLDHALDATAAASRTVVVGPQRPTEHNVTWTREEPVGGGPVAGIAAGLALVTSEHVLVVAGDMPKAGRAVPALVDAYQRQSGRPAVAEDGQRLQPLLALWPADALRQAVARVQRGPRLSATALYEHAAPVRVEVPAVALRDVDTPDELPKPG